MGVVVISFYVLSQFIVQQYIQISLGLTLAHFRVAFRKHCGEISVGDPWARSLVRGSLQLTSASTNSCTACSPFTRKNEAGPLSIWTAVLPCRLTIHQGIWEWRVQSASFLEKVSTHVDPGLMDSKYSKSLNTSLDVASFSLLLIWKGRLYLTPEDKRVRLGICQANLDTWLTTSHLPALSKCLRKAVVDRLPMASTSFPCTNFLERNSTDMVMPM
jgi:hypothetical protein